MVTKIKQSSPKREHKVIIYNKRMVDEAVLPYEKLESPILTENNL